MDKPLKQAPVIYRYADISPCQTYRYSLIRRWNSALPYMGFIMLNPSTADADRDDATIRRCTTFAKREACGGFIVMNLFAFRATRPEDMIASADPVGPMNEQSINNALNYVDGPLVAAWGVRGGHLAQDKAVRVLVGQQPLFCLGTTNDGHPRHPLYVRSDQPLIRH